MPPSDKKVFITPEYAPNGYAIMRKSSILSQ